MSHLTAPMPPSTGHHHAHKPMLFDLPRPAHPLTPPDTDYETLSHQAPVPQPAQNFPGLEVDPLHPHYPASMADSPFASPYNTLHRKRPSVTYVNSGIREARERVVQRGLKWLVVVIPPVSFSKEHGHLGHTLSSGPNRRLSNGLLMPLYPTLSSQLGAIAREFSFPSIAGICIYLHTTHGGISLAPRVSDESWPMLWNHLFDPRSPSLPPAQLPISGQIEFDIDYAKARWFEAWVASYRRDAADVPQSVAPSRPQSLSHWRHDSQTSINEPADDQSDVISLAQQTTARGPGRNIKKLSLLDRFDAMSFRSGSKLVPRDESPPSQTGRTTVALSPIVQEEEPMTAKKDIDKRVNSWRMSAGALTRSPMAATGQTSLDPVNMPNTIQDLPTGSASEFELNLDDYAWSISSVGPQEYELESVSSWARVPSVHMDRRGEGSVCLTASVCTSFGPNSDYEPFSPVSYVSRLPSPDIAWRMIEDVPPTPTTATSWGAPLSYPPSPAAYSYAPSIDIAARHMSSRPVTPMTATSWGAPLSYPPSPAMFSRADSPDLGARYADSAAGSPVRYPRALPEEPYDIVYPYYDAARASTWKHVYPYTDAATSSGAWQHVWPYTEQHASTWQHVWPYQSVEEPREIQRMNAFAFPPRQSTQARSVIDVVAPSVTLGYPVFDLYPAVYPSFDIYPALVSVDDHHLSVPVVSSGAAYPVFDLYPAVYPSFAIYPPVLTLEISGPKELPTRLVSSYPHIEIYPAVYPELVIYPPVSSERHTVVATNAVVTTRHSSGSELSYGYPDFNLYPAVLDVDYTAYPWSLKMIYPEVVKRDYTAYPWSLLAIYPAVESVSRAASSMVVVDIILQSCYPTFNIYPAVYPYSLECIYPSVVAEASAKPSALISVGVQLQYPVFDIYPAPGPGRASVQAIDVGHVAAYPNFNIYPAAYPWSVYEIYPEVCRPKVECDGVPVMLSAEYPVFNIYPPVYPHIVLYPAVASEENTAIRVDLQNKASAVFRYPFLVIYPAVYPCIEIYPSSWGHVDQGMEVQPSHTAARTYTPRFTHMELRAQVMVTVKSTATPLVPAPIAQRRKPKYTHMQLREQVFAEARARAPPPPVSAPAPPSPRAIPPASPAPSRAMPPPPVPPVPSVPLVSPVPTRALPPAVPAPGRAIPPPPAAPARIPSPSPPKSILRRSISPARSPVSPSMVPTIRAPSPARTPTPDRSASPSRMPPAVRPRPAAMDLPGPPSRSHMAIPTIVAVEPSPTTTNESPATPVLFEMVTASPTPSPVPMSAPAADSTPSAASPRPRSRSGTVNARPMSIAGTRPPPPPPAADLPPLPPVPAPAPSPQRKINRLSGLPSHPAMNRRTASVGGGPAPRPMSTFGAIPSQSEPSSSPAAAASPIARRQMSMMSPLAEEGRSLVGGRSPQFPSPAEDYRGSRTPTDSLDSPLLSARADLSRSKTMPTRTTPRGPRSSTLIMERSKVFANPNVVPSDDAPLKLSMSALSEFPQPPLPPMPTSASSPSPSRPVSKLDRSRYPFQ